MTEPRPSLPTAAVAPGPRRRLGRGALIAAGVAIALAAAGAAAWLGMGLRRPADPDRVWLEAQRALAANRFEEAGAGLRRLERLRPPTGEDLVLRAQLATAAGSVDEALAALARVDPAHPLASQAHLLAGRLERSRGRPRPAEASFLRALELDPACVDARKELIYIYGIQLRRREVDAQFRALARLTPPSHHDLFTWMTTHFSAWNPDVARDLQGFVDADPADRFSRLALAEILLDQTGEGARVAGLLDALPEDDPDALALRAELDLREGRPDQAEARIGRGPAGHPRLERLRGRLAVARGDHAAAAAHFRLALSDEPYDRVSCFDLGQALALGGQAEAAGPLLDRARKLNAVYNLVNQVKSPGRENRAGDLVELAAACEAAGLLDEAEHWFNLALSRDPLNEAAQRGLYRLRAARPPATPGEPRS